MPRSARRRKMNQRGKRVKISSRRFVTLSAGAVAAFVLTGCTASLPERAGYLSDYSNLETIESNRMRFVSPELGSYDAFMVDPVEFSFEGDLNAEHRASLANHTRTRLVTELRASGVEVVDEPGVDTARVRIGLTDIAKAKWYLNLHPVTKVTGVGLGGASMEAEIIDSVTGAQLAAVIRSDYGSRLELDMFSTLDDARDAINAWAKEAAARIAELRETSG
ncbi:MAG: DUF3313 domain-containing protein [Planctomycetota bacterium]